MSEGARAFIARFHGITPMGAVDLADFLDAFAAEQTAALRGALEVCEQWFAAGVIPVAEHPTRFRIRALLADAGPHKPSCPRYGAMHPYTEACRCDSGQAGEAVFHRDVPVDGCQCFGCDHARKKDAAVERARQ